MGCWFAIKITTELNRIGHHHRRSPGTIDQSTLDPRGKESNPRPADFSLLPQFQSSTVLADFFAGFAMEGVKSKAESDNKLKTKAAKDPSRPKIPPIAMNIFLKDFKEGNPNYKRFPALWKAGHKEWKAMSIADKAPYVAKAGNMWAEYTKNMEAYKRTSAGREMVKRAEMNRKAAMDPNRPKWPQSAVVIFLEEFKIRFMEENPNNKSILAWGKAGGKKWNEISVAVKAGGKKWNEMSVADKAPYVAKAEKMKAEYTKYMEALKSKSDVQNLRLKTNAGEIGKRAGMEGKASKDPNKPKRPQSAVVVFLEEFKIRFKKENPNNKSIPALTIDVGINEWNAMSVADKAPYVAKAEKMKAEYTNYMEAHDRKLAGGGNDDEESDKSKSDVHDEDEEDDDGDE